MATPSKERLVEELRALGAVPPADASSKELQALLKRVKGLTPHPIQGRKPPRPVPAPRFTPEPVTSSPSAAQVLATTPQPRRMSDHELRPWDPFAGW